MKVGDLVKLKWVTFASKRRAAQRNAPVDELGLIIEEFEGAIKVIFPSQHKKTFSFLKDHVELICEL
ncbi:MAG: hypothetical protein CME70_19060 [Halobacteriovorax sp.]|nr:hypothetical protein [Halobacteriovorax sp.]|tara:strand:+ start:356 stop:556 length:201 start_codon:yes stop_codon:yes gene_type:complete